MYVILFLLRPLLIKQPVRSSADICMYVTETESMILKFLTLFFFQASLHVNPHRVYYDILTSFCKVHYNSAGA